MDVYKRDEIYSKIVDEVNSDLSKNWFENIKVNLNSSNPIFLR